MRQVANDSTATSRRALTGSLTAAFTCVALLVSCSSSAKHSAPHVTTTAHKSVPTTTTGAPKTTTTAPLITYKVKRGDRLTTIAKRFRVSVPAIVFVNRIANPDRVTDGQVLKNPSHPPLALVVTPVKGPQGQKFALNVIGSKPSEVIRFEIDSSTGKHIGPPHTASTDGAVTTKYQTSVASATGTYKVIASGNKGTKTKASFVVAKGH